MPDADKTAPARKPLEIDFPLAGEIVTAPYYTFRIAAYGSARIDISIDGGDWLPCRFWIGYWWHDWSDYESGAHSVSARSRDADGAITAVESRRVDVRIKADAEGDELPRRRVRRVRSG